MEELIFQNMKEILMMQMPKTIFKISDFKVFFKLGKTGFSAQFRETHIL